MRKSRKLKNKVVPKYEKIDSQIAHFIASLKSRFEIDATEEDVTTIANQIIENGNETFIDAQSNRVSRHLIKFKNVEFVVVYDKLRNTPVTALYKEWIVPEKCEEWVVPEKREEEVS